MAEPRYNPDKFKELVVYVASKTGDDPRCGDMKLNKLLYFMDVTAFRRTGQAITGAAYKHQPRGPIAVPLLPARRDLERRGRVAVHPRDYQGFEQTATEAKDDPQTDLFDPAELSLIDEVIEKFWDYDGTAMERIAHDEPGWKMTKEDERIPYRAALIAKSASPRAIQRGHELASRLGW
jgi:uncharacterized phage-associated protein